jgi:hypothetical protein
MGTPHELRTKTVLCYLEHNLLPKPHIPDDLQAVKADDAWDRLKTLQEVAYLLLQSRDQESGVRQSQTVTQKTSHCFRNSFIPKLQISAARTNMIKLASGFMDCIFGFFLLTCYLFEFWP